MQIGKNGTILASEWAIQRYKVNSGGVDVRRTKQLKSDKPADKLYNPMDAVKITISEEAKELNRFRVEINEK